MKIFNIDYLFCAGTYGGIYMFTCVQVHMFVWMSMLTCVCAYGNQRTISDRITEAPPILFVVFLGFGVFVCLFVFRCLTHLKFTKKTRMAGQWTPCADWHWIPQGWDCENLSLLGFFFSHLYSDIHAQISMLARQRVYWLSYFSFIISYFNFS